MTAFYNYPAPTLAVAQPIYVSSDPTTGAGQSGTIGQIATDGTYWWEKVTTADTGWRLITLLASTGIFSRVGYRDLVSDLSRSTVVGGGASLSLTAFQGNTKAYVFTHAASSSNGLLVAFHVDHDIDPVTPTGYIHVHSSPMTAGQSGTVDWKFEYTIAKGHNQAAFPATQTIDLTCTTSATRYQHQITEDATGISLLEPDTLILGFVYRSGATETCTGDQALLYCDFHYRCDRLATANKAPSFE